MVIKCFVLAGKPKDPHFAAFFVGCGRKKKKKLALPSSFCCFAVGRAGVPDCALFATLELCTYGRVRVREGFSGKRRDRRFSVVKGVVWHLVCLMFCAPPPPPPLE